ncbi:MAG: hypothetical protein KDC98_21780 [Planctomycetes bacterium]|nr:hypothetical protein [Planctomycetota bacterium]
MNTITIRPVLAAACATVLVTGVAFAQTNHNLLGTTQTTMSLQQSRHSGCVTLGSCTPPGLLPNPVFYAGGVAYDGTSDTIWATDGWMLGRYQGPSGCVPACTPVPCPKSSTTANATGLDVVESLGELWITDDAGWLTRTTLACPPTVTASCPLLLPTGTVPTDVAVDDGRGIFFVCALNSTLGISELYVYQLGSACGPEFSVTPLISCTSSSVPAVGIAADWGNQRIYWTNGPDTFSFPYSYNPSGPSIAYGLQTCCTFVVSPNDPYTDLTLRPRISSPAGNPCSNGTCPSCLNWHSLRNAPILGNTLQLGLDDAPESALAWCMVGLGPCSPGPTFPPLCGPLWVTPSTALGAYPTGGSVGCNGTATALLALPLIPALAGLPLSSQWIVLCSGSTGTAMSNCQSWILLGS